MNDKTLVTGNAADSAEELDTTSLILFLSTAKDGTKLVKMSWTPVKAGVKVTNDAAKLLEVMAKKGDLIHEEHVYAPDWEALQTWKAKTKVKGFGLGIPAQMIFDYVSKSKSELAIVPRAQARRSNDPQFRLGVITKKGNTSAAPTGYDDLIVAE